MFKYGGYVQVKYTNPELTFWHGQRGRLINMHKGSNCPDAYTIKFADDGVKTFSGDDLEYVDSAHGAAPFGFATYTAPIEEKVPEEVFMRID